MRKVIDFPEVIINKVKDCMVNEGHKTFPSAIISMVSGYYDKKFINKYKTRKGKSVIPNPEDNMDDEQFCEYKGGTLGKHNGLDGCIVPRNEDGSMVEKIPLEQVKSLLK